MNGPNSSTEPLLPSSRTLIAVIGLIALALTLTMATIAGAQEEPPAEITITQEASPCEDLGSFCDRLLEWTGSEAFAETTA